MLLERYGHIYVLMLFYIHMQSAACFHAMFEDKGTQIHSNVSKKIEKTILDQCFTNKPEQIVVFVNWSHCNYNYLFKSGSKSFTLMGINENDTLEKYMMKIKRYKIPSIDTITKPLPVNKVLIDNFDKKNFQLTLFKLKNSLHWNNDASFFINNGESFDSCADAYSFLRIIWDFNILSAVFLCQDSDINVRLYTFNPYSQDAPKFWKGVGFYKQINGHILTMLMNAQELIFSPVVPSLCEVLWFDKTKDLAGYPIQLTAPDFPTRYKDKTTGEIKKYYFFDASRKVFSIILRMLKTNYTITYYNVANNSGKIDSNGIPSGITAEVLRGKYDMRTGGDSQKGLFKNEVNSFKVDGQCFIFSKTKLSISYQLVLAFPLEFWCPCITSSIIIIILFKHLLKLNYLKIGIDILRGLLGSSMMYEPPFLLGKLIFILFVFAFMILSNYLQSALPAMLTIATVHDQNIRTPWDLINNGYKVYTSPYVNQYYIGTPIYKNGLYVKDVLDCLKLIKNDTTVACINFYSLTEIVVTESDNVHIYKYDPSEKYIVHLLRDDFPLRNLIESLYLRLYEGGIPQRFYNFDIIFIQKTILLDYTTLSLNELKYIFYFPVMVYAFCICVFMIELSRVEFLGSF